MGQLHALTSSPGKPQEEEVLQQQGWVTDQVTGPEVQLLWNQLVPRLQKQLGGVAQ